MSKDMDKGKGSGKQGAVGGKVIDMQPKKPKVTIKEKVEKYISAMQRDPLIKAMWGEANTWPLDIRTTVDQMGNKLWLEISPENEVRIVSGEDYIRDNIAKYAWQIAGNIHEVWYLNQSQVSEVYKTYKAMADEVEDSEIAGVLCKSEPGLCWKRLPFDLNRNQPTPTFDEMMSRIDNRDALMAWIGSLFVPHSSRDHYVWLYGDGGQGKSRLAYFLKTVLGEAYATEYAPSERQGINRFWTSGLIGKRLVVFPDCNETWIVRDSTFKSLTGEDSVRIEFKGMQPRSMEMVCKFMFISNEKPAITGSRADVRRVIYCEMEPLAEGTKVVPTRLYDQMLWDEAPGFLAKCREKYAKIAGDYSTLLSENKAIDDLLLDNETEFLNVAKRIFEFVDGEEVATSDVYQIFKKERWSNKKVSDFYAYLSRNFQVEKRRTRINDNLKPMVLSGVKLRQNVANEFGIVTDQTDRAEDNF